MQLLTGVPRLDQAEDSCLTLNVWTPAADGKRRPELVWVHGSGWISCASGFPGYHGHRLAAGEGIVVVAPNYRLGPLGYLCLPGMAPGNVGFLDIIATLRWVREHIANFGGDPELVTATGRSGSAVTALALMTSPPAQGPFCRVVSQSGPLGVPMPSLDEARQVAEAYRDVMGLSPDSVDKLRTMPAEELVAGFQRLVVVQDRRPIGAPAPPMHPGGWRPRPPGTRATRHRDRRRARHRRAHRYHRRGDEPVPGRRPGNRGHAGRGGATRAGQLRTGCGSRGRLRPLPPPTASGGADPDPRRRHHRPARPPPRP
jgi:carboxylesterase type B